MKNIDIKLENVTPEILKETFGDDVSKAIEYLKTFLGEYPKSISKPKLKEKHTSDDVIEYLKQIQQYEEEKLHYNFIIQNRNKISSIIDNLIEEYIKNISGLRTSVPVEYQDKVYRKAYQDGSYAGYYEVYLKLISLIEIFE